MESIIKWRTGVPRESGVYLITYRNLYETTIIGVNDDGSFIEQNNYHIGIGTSYFGDGMWHNYDSGDGGCTVIAWCPLNEIEPYKE